MFNSKAKEKLNEVEKRLERLVEQFATIQYCEGCHCLIGKQHAAIVKHRFTGIFGTSEYNKPYCLKCKPEYDVVDNGVELRLVPVNVNKKKSK